MNACTLFRAVPLLVASLFLPAFHALACADVVRPDGSGNVPVVTMDTSVKGNSTIASTSSALVSTPSQVRAQVVDDTNLRQAFHDRPWGNLTYVHFASDPGNINCARYGLYRFALPDRSTIGEVLAVRLMVFVYHSTIESDEAIRLKAHHVYSFPAYQVGALPWNEDSVTWDTRPTDQSQFDPVPESTYDYHYQDGYPFWMDLDVTDMVHQEYSQGKDEITILVTTEDLSGRPAWEDFVKTRSKESTFSGEHPHLLMTVATPVEPSTWGAIKASFRDATM